MTVFVIGLWCGNAVTGFTQISTLILYLIMLFISTFCSVSIVIFICSYSVNLFHLYSSFADSHLLTSITTIILLQISIFSARIFPNFKGGHLILHFTHNLTWLVLKTYLLFIRRYLDNRLMVNIISQLDQLWV